VLEIDLEAHNLASSCGSIRYPFPARFLSPSPHLSSAHMLFYFPEYAEEEKQVKQLK
jgi:hypothetical protein